MFDLYFNSENLFVESLELISKKKNDYTQFKGTLSAFKLWILLDILF